jgi:hypothetical protein
MENIYILNLGILLPFFFDIFGTDGWKKNEKKEVSPKFTDIFVA